MLSVLCACIVVSAVAGSCPGRRKLCMGIKIHLFGCDFGASLMHICLYAQLKIIITLSYQGSSWTQGADANSEWFQLCRDLCGDVLLVTEREHHVPANANRNRVLLITESAHFQGDALKASRQRKQAGMIQVSLNRSGVI